MVEIGIIIGLLIGLTGLGSGSLLTPMLILIGGMTPATAVGTSLAFAFLTKLYGSWNFYRRGMVQMDIVRDLSIGSLPGVLAGAFVIRYLGIRRPEALDTFLLRSIGLVLVIMAIVMLLRLLPMTLRPESVDRRLVLPTGMRRGVIIFVGFVVGASVTMTSIGSGAALIPVMILFYRLESGTLVGTNVAMGMILAGVAAIPHFGLGNVDWKAVAGLLCGSVPALWLGSHAHGRIPRQVTEGLIAVALLGMGVRIMAF
jgi:uncharacterized membrane protein YfcA